MWRHLLSWRHLAYVWRIPYSVWRLLYYNVWRHFRYVWRHLLSMWGHFRIPGWMFETLEVEACHDRKLPHRQLLRGFLNKNVNFHFTEKSYQLFRQCSIAVVKQQEFQYDTWPYYVFMLVTCTLIYRLHTRIIKYNKGRPRRGEILQTPRTFAWFDMNKYWLFVEFELMFKTQPIRWTNLVWQTGGTFDFRRRSKILRLRESFQAILEKSLVVEKNWEFWSFYP